MNKVKYTTIQSTIRLTTIQSTIRLTFCVNCNAYSSAAFKDFDSLLYQGRLVFVCKKAFYPTALKDCRGIVFTHGVWMGGWVAGKSLSRLYLGNRKV